MSHICLDCQNNRELMRALHTLHGSADMAEVESIAKVSTALESLVKRQKPLDNREKSLTLDLIERGTEIIQSVLDVINVPGVELPGWEQLLAEITPVVRFLRR